MEMESNNKIAFVLFGFYESSLSLAKALAERGINVDVFCYLTNPKRRGEFFGFKYSTKCLRIPGLIYEIDYDKSKGVNFLADSGSHVYLMQGFFSGGSLSGLSKKILGIIGGFIMRALFWNFNRKKYDFVDFVPLGKFSENAISLIKSPCIVSLHEICDRVNNCSFEIDSTTKEVIKLKKYIRVFSDATSKKLFGLTCYDRRRCYVVPFGLFINYLDFEETIIPELNNEQNYILFIGMISQYKGLDLLYQAINKIGRGKIDAKYVVAGMGYVPILEEMKNNKNIIVINRYLHNEEFVTLIKKSMFIVCPYINASQSGLPQTAYLFGKPVIATNVGAFPKVIIDGRTGLIISPNSPEELSLSIIRLVNDKSLYDEMVSNIRDIYDNFPLMNWNNIVERYLKMINEVSKSSFRR